MMIGKEQSLQMLEEEVQDHLPKKMREKYECAINRVRYEFAKIDGRKPKYHKGKRVKDWYTCGNCGHIVDVGPNYCPNCGYAIKWDSVRCLTR